MKLITLQRTMALIVGIVLLGVPVVGTLAWVDFFKDHNVGALSAGIVFSILTLVALFVLYKVVRDYTDKGDTE